MLGPAGAGKTTVVQALIRRGVAVRSQLQLPWATKVRVLGGIARDVVPAYWREQPHKRFFNLEELRRMLYIEGWQSQLARPVPDGAITILDHGPIFMLGIVREFGPDFARHECFIRWCDHAVKAWSVALDLVLWLDAPNAILLQRIERRQRDHVIKGKPYEEGCVYLDRCRLSFERLLSEMTACGGPNVLRVDAATVAPDDIAECFLQALDLGSTLTSSQLPDSGLRSAGVKLPY